MDLSNLVEPYQLIIVKKLLHHYFETFPEKMKLSYHDNKELIQSSLDVKAVDWKLDHFGAVAGIKRKESEADTDYFRRMANNIVSELNNKIDTRNFEIEIQTVLNYEMSIKDVINYLYKERNYLYDEILVYIQ